MEAYEIVDYMGETIEQVRAYNERHALCIYLMTHEELEDMMLWKSVCLNNYDASFWKLAEYDSEDEYFRARKITA